MRSKLDKKAVLGGKDSDGSPIYVGKALHNGVYLPAKIIPSKNACYIGKSNHNLIKLIERLLITKRKFSTTAYNGVEVFVENFEVLEAKENKFTWEPASDGRIAAGAVSTGREGNDEIFIGRAPYQGSMTVGKVSKIFL